MMIPPPYKSAKAISPQERARKAGVLFDYFSVSIYENIAELMVHAKVNHENAVRFAHQARQQLRHGHRDAHRSHELACEDKAHAHSILARGEELRGWTGEADAIRIRELRKLCKRTLAIKL
jgi:hypothetical protein